MVLKQTLTIPPLEGGDRLSRDEFEQRYQAASYIKKAELIEGVVYVASAVRSKSHAQPHAAIMTWLGAYWSATPGVDLNWFRWQNGQYVSLQPNENGIVLSSGVSRTVAGNVSLAGGKYGNCAGNVARGREFVRTRRVCEGIITKEFVTVDPASAL